METPWGRWEHSRGIRDLPTETGDVGTRTPRGSGDIPGNTLGEWGHLGESGTTWGDRHAEVTGDVAHRRETGNTLGGTGPWKWEHPREMRTLWRDRERGDGDMP